MMNLPKFQYDFKEFIDIARIHKRKIQLETPPVYKTTVLKTEITVS